MCSIFRSVSEALFLRSISLKIETVTLRPFFRQMYENSSPSNICLFEHTGVDTAAVLQARKALVVQALHGVNGEGISVINNQPLLISSLSPTLCQRAW